MRDRARAVIIGGGITGCSVAYHLARAGWSDLVLIDKGPLTSGSTCHAAGLVTQFNPSPTMMRFRRYSIELYRELGVFETVGSVRIASSPESLGELQRGVSRARAIGLDVELASPAETLRLLPQASPESLYGSVYLPGDGNLDPHSATYALAGAARDLGAEIRTGERVTGIELGPRHEVRAVLTECGRIETEVVVNAAGMWAPQVAAMAGAQLVSIPVEHQHIALAAVAGHELPRDLPCFRDPDYLVYGKSEAGGVLFGGYEHDPVARWIDGVPWDHSGQTVPADEARFAPLMQGAAQRFPFLADAGVVKLVCHPDAMTPDGNPLVGELPGVPGFFVAAGLSLNGFGGAGGIGKAMAELVTSGESELDLQAYRPWRFGAVHRDPRYAAENAREAYRYYYRLRYPLDNDVLGRPRRTSALHERMQDAGAVFATQERLGARRLLRAREAVAQGGGGAARLRLGGAALRRPARRGVRRAARARGHDRHDVVRQDRGRGPGRRGAARARVRCARRPRARERRLHAVPERAWRHRRRCDRDAPRRAALPRRHGRGGDRLRPRLAALAPAPG